MRYLAIAMLGLLVAGCGGAADDSAGSADVDSRGGPIGEGYVEALDKAEAVDEMARERKARLDEAADPPE